ncbi:MAG TPA: hypothetical protein VHV83_06335 [Armatimonadota bacterium]|nr:hypothetical protein [Armatimonadota bacterium]
MRMMLWLVLLVSLATALTGCPALNGLLGAGSKEGGSGKSDGEENRREEREDDDEKDESAIPRLQWSVAYTWDDVQAHGDVCTFG